MARDNFIVKRQRAHQHHALYLAVTMRVMRREAARASRDCPCDRTQATSCRGRWLRSAQRGWLCRGCWVLPYSPLCAVARSAWPVVRVLGQVALSAEGGSARRRREKIEVRVLWVMLFHITLGCSTQQGRRAPHPGLWNCTTQSSPFGSGFGSAA